MARIEIKHIEVGDFFADKLIHWHIRRKSDRVKVQMIRDDDEAINWMKEHSNRIISEATTKISLGELNDITSY